MKKIIKKLLIIGGLLIVVSLLVLGWEIVNIMIEIKIEENERVYLPVSQLDYPYVDVEIIRKVTNCELIPEFEVEKFWYYKSDSTHSSPYIECRFKKEMTEKEFYNMVDPDIQFFWDWHSTGSLYFKRGWTEDEYMKIPEGMAENMVMTIRWMNEYSFEIVYEKNHQSEKIDDDILKELSGYKFPPFEVISYINYGDYIHADLLFSEYIDKLTADTLSFSNDSIHIYLDKIINDYSYSFEMDRNDLHAHIMISERDY